MRSRILYLSGRHDDARRLSLMLDGLPLDIDHTSDLQQAREMLRQMEYHIILSEASLSDGTWVDLLHLAGDCARNLKVIVTDPHADARFWAEALNLGAYDVLAQPFYAPEVRRILYNACARPMATPEVQHLIA
jgi:DNA-binding NtrC family response regulator